MLLETLHSPSMYEEEYPQPVSIVLIAVQMAEFSGIPYLNLDNHDMQVYYTAYLGMSWLPMLSSVLFADGPKHSPISLA